MITCVFCGIDKERSTNPTCREDLKEHAPQHLGRFMGGKELHCWARGFPSPTEPFYGKE